MNRISKEEFLKLIEKSDDIITIKDMDLSNIDLSDIELSDITRLRIIDSNLKNTNLNIDFFSLDGVYLVDSNLTGVSFSFNEKEVKESNRFKSINFENVIFDRLQSETLNRVVDYFALEESEPSNGGWLNIDLETIINNNIKVQPKHYVYAIDKYQYSRITYDNMDEYKIKVEKILERYPELETICNSIEPKLTDLELYYFIFKFSIHNKTFKNLTMTKDMAYFFQYIRMYDCKFENLKIDFQIGELQGIDKYFPLHRESKIVIDGLSMPKIDYSDYKTIKFRRFLNTPITFRKSLYVELDRLCNGRCAFCRNNCLESSTYDFANILSNLKKCISEFDTIFIGGGEPTLKTDDLIRLVTILSKNIENSKKINVCTNGTNFDYITSIFKFDNIMPRFYLSRHSYKDDENAEILGINESLICTPSSLHRMSNYSELTLVCTCINGGMDTSEKILRYIDNYNYEGINMLFSNLQEDASLTTNNDCNNQLQIDSHIFDEVIKCLQIQGYQYTYPVISSSGYELYTLKRSGSDSVISFKKYINKNDLKEKWETAVKRTFDLSMTPDGSIYENWRNKGKKLLLENIKRN